MIHNPLLHKLHNIIHCDKKVVVRAVYSWEDEAEEAVVDVGIGGVQRGDPIPIAMVSTLNKLLLPNYLDQIGDTVRRVVHIVELE